MHEELALVIRVCRQSIILSVTRDGLFYKDIFSTVQQATVEFLVEVVVWSS